MNTNPETMRKLLDGFNPTIVATAAEAIAKARREAIESDKQLIEERIANFHATVPSYGAHTWKRVVICIAALLVTPGIALGIYYFNH